MEHLDLTGNNIVTLPDSLAKLKILKSLWLQNCSLVGCPPVISEITNLKELSLAENAIIQELPESLKNLEKLNKLNISSCGLDILPEVVFELKELKRLYLRNNEIDPEKSVSSSLSNLKELEVLDLSQCGLTSFPEVITKLLKLRYLFLDRNSITSLPGSLKNLKKNLRGLVFPIVSSPLIPWLYQN